MKRWILFLVLPLGLCSVLSAFGGPTRAYYVAVTNAVCKAADAGRCRWGSFRMREFFEDEVLQDELDAALTAGCPTLYESAKACSGKAGDPALVALHDPFIVALTNTPTLRQVAACAAGRGFSSMLSVTISELCLLDRKDGRRCFCGGVTCSSVSADSVRILACMIPVFRKGAAAEPLMRVAGSGLDARGLSYVSSFSPQGDVYTFAASDGVPEMECGIADRKNRRIHPPTPLVSVDTDRLWNLLSGRVGDLKPDLLLKLLGRPSEVFESPYSCYGRKDYGWCYEFTDKMDDGTPFSHRLRLTLTKKGSCVGWTWRASAGQEEGVK